MHKFDPTTEPATVQIEVNPRRYVTVAKVDSKGKVLRLPDGKDDVTLLRVMGNTPGNESRMWVPPRIANDLTQSSGTDTSLGVPPTARIIGSRTADDIPGNVKTTPTRKKE